jgi:peptide/nickel transport system ATP-binding protein
VVAEITQRLLVMYAGNIVEEALVTDAFARPTHPYTQGLLRSVKSLESQRHNQLEPIPGIPPSLINMPSGCAFHLRCSYAHQLGDRCVQQRPLLREVGASRTACHATDDVLLSLGLGDS